MQKTDYALVLNVDINGIILTGLCRTSVTVGSVELPHPLGSAETHDLKSRAFKQLYKLKYTVGMTGLVDFNKD